MVLLTVFTAGCSKKEEPVSTPQPAKRIEAAKPPMPVQEQQSTARVPITAAQYVEFSGKKDPFKPFVMEIRPMRHASRKGSFSGLLPIQNYEVNQFRVLGIIAGLKQNNALVVDPTGKTYVVKPGMEIGKNGGEIQKISARSVEVVEKYRDESGKIRKRTVRLSLPVKE